MPKLTLLGLAPLLLSGCAAIYSADRFTPSLLDEDAPLTATTLDHDYRKAGARWRWSGEDRLIELRGDDDGPAFALTVGVVDGGGALWAVGPLLPVIPVLGLLRDDLEDAIHVQLRLVEGEAPVTLDPREVELGLEGAERSVRPSHLTEWGYRWYDATPVEDVEVPVVLEAGDTLQLFFPGRLENAERMTLRLPLERADGSRLVATIAFERGTALYFVLAG